MRLFKNSVVAGLILFAFLTLAVSKPAFAVLSATSATDVVMDLGNATEDGGLNGVNFTGDGTLTIRSGSAINSNALANGVTTATNNTGSLGFLGYSTVTGVVGTATTGLIRQITAGTADTRVSFTGANVFATTTTVRSTGTLQFSGNLTSTTVNFAGNGSVIMADNATLTGTITTDTNGTGSLGMLGTGLVTGQVGTSAARLATVTGGFVTEKVDFSSDVFAVTTRVSGTGTLVFAGNATGTTLNFNGNGRVDIADGKNLAYTTISTSTTDTGSITFRGASTISGELGSVAGNDVSAVNINGGIVTLNNGASDYAVTTTTVNSGGTLRFTAATDTITGGAATTALTIASGGTLDLNTTTVTENVGGLTLASGSTMKTTFNSSTVFGSIAATAVAPSVAAGATVAVTFAGYVPNGAYTIIDAGAAGITLPTTITSSSPGVTISGRVTSSDLIFDITRNYSGIATSSTSTAVGTSFSSFAASATGDASTIVAAFDALTTAAQQNTALQQLDPDMNGGINQAAINSTGASLSTINTRLDNARNGVSSGGGQHGIATGDEFTDVGVWVQGFGAYGDQDDVNGIAGYTAGTWGTAGGLDWKLNADNRLGLSFAYGKSNIDANGGNSGTDVDSYQGTIYESYNQPNYYVDSMLSFGWNEYDASRHIVFSTIDRTANSSYSGQQYSAKATFGYKLPQEQFVVVPLASLLYSHMHIGGYTETGADSIDLVVNPQGYDFLQSGLGAKIEIPVKNSANNLDWVPEFHALWMYEFIGDEASSTSRFTSGTTTFKTTGFSPEQSSFNLGTGVTYNINDSVSLNLKYDFEYRTDYTGHSGSGTVRWQF